MRSRYAEDCLAEAFDEGVRQYVLLGAGLDTFAYRQL
jgi:O-methyltransferase involved in polyketide biosynthesis